MKLILCLDDKKGMMFNRRRQSRDSLLIKDLVSTCQEEPLFIAPYSTLLFQETPVQIQVVDDPLAAAKTKGICFLEGPLPKEYEDQIDLLILYHWNRHYPADVWFTMQMDGFTLMESSEFAGSSHEKITKEVWRK